MLWGNGLGSGSFPPCGSGVGSGIGVGSGVGEGSPPPPKLSPSSASMYGCMNIFFNIKYLSFGYGMPFICPVFSHLTGHKKTALLGGGDYLFTGKGKPVFILFQLIPDLS
jgi:hypothetical protein